MGASLPWGLDGSHKKNAKTKRVNCRSHFVRFVTKSMIHLSILNKDEKQKKNRGRVKLGYWLLCLQNFAYFSPPLPSPWSRLSERGSTKQQQGQARYQSKKTSLKDLMKS